MNIFDYDTGAFIGGVPYRPLAAGSIVQFNKVDYNLRERHSNGAYIKVTKRPGAFGQVATPDYVLDDMPTMLQPGHKIRIVDAVTDDFIREDLVTRPGLTLEAGQIIEDDNAIPHRLYRLVDWSIGRRRVDELYVEEVK